MICSFWDTWSKDALTAICALILLVFIKTAITSWFIANISFHGPKQPHTNYLENRKAPVSISDRKTFQTAESRPRRKAGGNENVGWLHWGYNTLPKRPDCTGLNWRSEARALHLPVTKLLWVEMPNASSLTMVQRLCIHSGSRALLADILMVQVEDRFDDTSPPFTINIYFVINYCYLSWLFQLQYFICHQQ